MLLTKPDEEKTVYGHRFEPRSYDEADAYHEGEAVAYELYVICSRSGEIEQVKVAPSPRRERRPGCSLRERCSTSNWTTSWRTLGGGCFISSVS